MLSKDLVLALLASAAGASSIAYAVRHVQLLQRRLVDMEATVQALQVGRAKDDQSAQGNTAALSCVHVSFMKILGPSMFLSVLVCGTPSLLCSHEKTGGLAA